MTFFFTRQKIKKKVITLLILSCGTDSHHIKSKLTTNKFKVLEHKKNLRKDGIKSTNFFFNNAKIRLLNFNRQNSIDGCEYFFY